MCSRIAATLFNAKGDAALLSLNQCEREKCRIHIMCALLRRNSSGLRLSLLYRLLILTTKGRKHSASLIASELSFRTLMAVGLGSRPPLAGGPGRHELLGSVVRGQPS